MTRRTAGAGGTLMIDLENPGLGFALKCAHCGNTNLHHDEVIVFERREDAQQGMRVMVAGVDRQDRQSDNVTGLCPSVIIDSTMFGNPSARRQGVHVGLWCEQCGQRSSLSIVQHKGTTHLECSRVLVGANAELYSKIHGKLLGFLRVEWERKDNWRLLSVDLLYAPGNGLKDEELRKWNRVDDPELFAEFANVEVLVTRIVARAEWEVNAKDVGRHRFVVRTHQHLGGRATHTFALSREAPGP